MKDLDEQIGTWSAEREHEFKIRGETFRGTLGLDYISLGNYMGAIRSFDTNLGPAVDALLLDFLDTAEFERFDAWRSEQRAAKNPLTVHEITLICSGIVEIEAARPTRASSGSSTGRETNGDGSTADSSSPGTEEAREHSLSAVS